MAPPPRLGAWASERVHQRFGTVALRDSIRRATSGEGGAAPAAFRLPDLVRRQDPCAARGLIRGSVSSRVKTASKLAGYTKTRRRATDAPRANAQDSRRAPSRRRHAGDRFVEIPADRASRP